MDVATQPRTPAGSPEGGQFAPTPGGAEASLTLSHGITIRDLEPAELLAICYKAAKTAYARYQRTMEATWSTHTHHSDDPTPTGAADHMLVSRDGFDLDDVTQDVLERMLTKQDATFTSVDGYAYRIASRTISDRMRRLNGRAAAQARRELALKIEQHEGEQPLPSMRDLIREVMDEWEPSGNQAKWGSFPTHAFGNRAGADVSLSGWTDATPHNTLTVHRDSTPLGVTGERVYDILDEGVGSMSAVKRARFNARALAWNAVAQMRGAPYARRASLSNNKVVANRAAIYAHPDGVKGACRDWEAGRDNGHVHALFAPWGAVTPTQQRAIVDVLLESDYGEELWESAMVMANVRSGHRFTDDGVVTE